MGRSGGGAIAISSRTLLRDPDRAEREPMEDAPDAWESALFLLACVTSTGTGAALMFVLLNCRRISS